MINPDALTASFWFADKEWAQARAAELIARGLRPVYSHTVIDTGLPEIADPLYDPMTDREGIEQRLRPRKELLDNPMSELGPMGYSDGDEVRVLPSSIAIWQPEGTQHPTGE